MQSHQGFTHNYDSAHCRGNAVIDDMSASSFFSSYVLKLSFEYIGMRSVLLWVVLVCQLQSIRSKSRHSVRKGNIQQASAPQDTSIMRIHE